MIADAADIHDNLRWKRFDERAAQVMNHSQSASTPRGWAARKKRPGLTQIVLVLLLTIAMPATAAAEESPWILLPEPRFMGHQVTQPIGGAKSTVLAVARITAVGPEFARTEEWKALGISDEQLLAATRKQAAGWLQGLEPRLVRNKRKVVEYGVLESDNVPVAASVLAPEFWTRFEGVFGPRMRVVMPNRHTVFIFPDLVGDLQMYTPMVMQAWRSRHPKVSLEVFELSDRTLRAIGAFEEP